MSHNATDIYFETIWMRLSSGLRKRIISAVTKSKQEKQKEVIVDAISPEHRDEIDWLAVLQDSGRGDAFIAVNIGAEGRKRDAIKLTSDMVGFVEDRVLQALEPSRADSGVDRPVDSRLQQRNREVRGGKPVQG